MKTTLPSAILGFTTLLAAADQVNPDAAILQNFSKRVDEYVQLRKNTTSKLPPLKATESPSKITHYQHELAEKIRKARRSAKQGDIFTPQIQKEFRRVIGLAMQPGDATRIRKSLKSGEPVATKPAVQPRINEPYPWTVPLQTTPPSLLLNLPRLANDIEYRFADHTLILWDAKANLIIDYMDDAGT